MKIGFMQGRLCDRVDGKIQAFPWQDWESEFATAESLGIGLMEWTLDQERLYESPLMAFKGREKIRQLSQQHGVEVRSLTGDCFMQAPFFKAEGAERHTLIEDLRAIIDACAVVDIRYVLIPLVDNGAIETREQEDLLVNTLSSMTTTLVEKGVQIVFESDFGAAELARFIARLPASAFGINYDIGNSAALGFDPTEEIQAYGERIVNVHVKDRVLNDTTVPLGTGAADFPIVFKALQQCGYNGNFILQTARAEDNDHAAAIARYRDMVEDWWQASGS